MKILKNDTVQIMLGKDSGKSGKVIRVMPKDGKVLVEGMNVYKKHMKKTRNSEGGIVEVIKPVNLSNVAVVCNACKKPTRIGFKMEGDSKIRICKKCQKAIA